MSFPVMILSQWSILVQYTNSKCETTPNFAFEIQLKTMSLAALRLSKKQIQKEIKNKQLSPPEKLF